MHIFILKKLPATPSPPSLLTSHCGEEARGLFSCQRAEEAAKSV